MRPQLNRTTLFGLGVVAAVAAAATGGGLYLSGRGDATPPANSAPLSASGLTSQTKQFVEKIARKSGVDPASVLEARGAGAAGERHSVLVGTDRAGRAQFAFFTRLGLTDFVNPAQLNLSPAQPMRVFESATGPTTKTSTVGVAGIVTDAVARVTIERGDGSIADVQLTPAPRDLAYSFFAAIGSDASTFPTIIRAYSSDGALAATHRVYTEPLCPQATPGCLDQ